MSAKDFVKWLLENKQFDEDWFFERWIKSNLEEWINIQSSDTKVNPDE